jgi:uroporphyrinogen-III synthase
MPSIFISRELGPESPFFQFFDPKDVQIHGQSLVEFHLRPFAELPACDWCFFSSRQAVRFFFLGLKNAGFALPKSVKIGVLGEGTAQALKNQALAPDFWGNGDPDTVGRAFGIVAEGQKVLFPRAAQSRESIQKSMSGTVEVINLVVYENLGRTEFELPHADVLVFTSPLNAQAYFAKYRLQAEQQVLAIGQTTADALRSICGGEVHIAESPSEAALAEKCQELLKKLD